MFQSVEFFFVIIVTCRTISNQELEGQNLHRGCFEKISKLLDGGKTMKLFFFFCDLPHTKS